MIFELTLGTRRDVDDMLAKTLQSNYNGLSLRYALRVEASQLVGALADCIITYLSR